MSKTTVNLQLPPRRHWYDLEPPIAGGICVVLLLLIGLIVGRVQSLRQQAVPTPAVALVYVATSVPSPAPTAAAVVAAVRYVTAFAAPDGDVLGPIPQPPISAVLARWGDGWVMVSWEAGQVWLRAADVGLPDVADLEPPQPAPAPVVVYQPVYQPANSPPAAAPTMAPEQYQVTNEPPAAPSPVWATSGPVRAEDFKEPDPRAACAFVGCLR